MNCEGVFSLQDLLLALSSLQLNLYYLCWNIKFYVNTLRPPSKHLVLLSLFFEVTSYNTLLDKVWQLKYIQFTEVVKL